MLKMTLIEQLFINLETVSWFLDRYTNNQLYLTYLLHANYSEGPV